MNKVLMGLWVYFDHVILKERSASEWDEVDFSVTTHPAKKLDMVKTGMIVGERYLNNGKTTYGRDNYGPEPGVFEVSDITYCLAVIKNPHVNPIWVPVEGTVTRDGTPIKDLL